MNHSTSIVEAVLFALIQEIGPRKFATALHNVSGYGEVFKKEFGDILDEEDKFLTHWFEGIDKLSEAAISRN